MLYLDMLLLTSRSLCLLTAVISRLVLLLVGFWHDEKVWAAAVVHENHSILG